MHGIVYVPESEAPQDPLEVEIKQLSEMLNQVKDEQSYIVVRERTHRNTAESTNGRVKWWSIFQLGVLFGEGIFQVWWLKRFFEVSCFDPDAVNLWDWILMLWTRSSVLFEIWYQYQGYQYGPVPLL